MNTQPQTPVLLFSKDGSVLLHSDKRQVIGWDASTLTQRYVCTGRLIGVSESGRLFVTETEPGRFRFWQCDSGKPAEPGSIDCDDFPVDVRFRVSLVRNARRSYDGLWIDITGKEPAVPFVVSPAGTSKVEVIDNWIVASASRRLALAWSWAEEEFDGAFGTYHEPSGARVGGTTLTVSRFHTVPPLYYYREHDWLITGMQSRFCVYIASTGKPFGAGQGEFEKFGGGDLVVPHPKQRCWLAVNHNPVLQKEKDKQGFVLLDISSGKTQPQELQHFHESTPVRGLAFHPGGQWIAAVLADGTVHVWDLASGSLRTEVSEKIS